jgi:hypothetical protein
LKTISLGNVHFRSIIAILLMTLLVIAILSFQRSEAQTLQQPQKFSEYISTTNGIKINYPSNWLKKDTGLPSSGQGPENKTVVVFTPPERGVIFRISVDRLPSNSTLRDVIQEEMKGISKVAELQPNVTIAKSAPTAISNHSAYEMQYGYSQKVQADSIPVRAMVVVTVVNHSKFAVSYAGRADQFLSNKQLADYMTDSLQIGKPVNK